MWLRAAPYMLIAAFDGRVRILLGYAKRSVLESSPTTAS